MGDRLDNKDDMDSSDDRPNNFDQNKSVIFWSQENQLLLKTTTIQTRVNKSIRQRVKMRERGRGGEKSIN